MPFEPIEDHPLTREAEHPMQNNELAATSQPA